MSARGWDAIWNAPPGRLAIAVEDGRLARVRRLPPGPDQPATHPVAADAVAQLQAWFDDPAHAFDLPLAPAPTRFQARLREALCALAPGQLVTYAALARTLGSSARAVGTACGANPLPVVVPCHRVVGTRGLGGYGGSAADAEALRFKRDLIALEGGDPGV